MNKESLLEEIYLFQLEKAAKQFKKYKNRIFTSKGINLTSDQWVLLKKIQEKEAINQKELARVSFREPASITRTLDILQQKKLIERRGTNDRRTYHIHLTSEGKKLVDDLLPLAVDLRKQGVKGFSKTEIDTLTKLLKRVFENFK